MNPLLNKYVELLLKWQKSINLISGNTGNFIWQRHIEDSLQLKKFIPASTNCIIDIGSGAGLPGIPLAIDTGIKTYLIESDRKKTIFIDEAIRQTKIDARTINSRIEDALINNVKEPVVITARALADLKKLFELINSLLEKNNITHYRLLLLKGKNVSRETIEAEKDWKFDYKIEKSETEEAASILVIDHLTRR